MGNGWDLGKLCALVFCSSALSFFSQPAKVKVMSAGTRFGKLLLPVNLKWYLLNLLQQMLRRCARIPGQVPHDTMQKKCLHWNILEFFLQHFITIYNHQSPGDDYRRRHIQKQSDTDEGVKPQGHSIKWRGQTQGHSIKWRVQTQGHHQNYHQLNLITSRYTGMVIYGVLRG